MLSEVGIWIDRSVDMDLGVGEGIWFGIGWVCLGQAMYRIPEKETIVITDRVIRCVDFISQTEGVL